MKLKEKIKQKKEKSEETDSSEEQEEEESKTGLTMEQQTEVLQNNGLYRLYHLNTLNRLVKALEESNEIGKKIGQTLVKIGLSDEEESEEDEQESI